MNRRKLFKQAFFGLAGLGVLLKSGLVEAAAKCSPNGPAGKKNISESDKAAKRLKYVENVNKVKPTHKKFTAGSNCANCLFFKNVDKGTGWAKCSMLANKYVSPCGWCKQYKVNKKLKKKA